VRLTSGSYGASVISHRNARRRRGRVRDDLSGPLPGSRIHVNVLNTTDSVYTTRGGSKVLLELSKLGATVSRGYLGAITLIVDPGSTPAGVGVGG
jgi:hypothetical protein